MNKIKFFGLIICSVFLFNCLFTADALAARSSAGGGRMASEGSIFGDVFMSLAGDVVSSAIRGNSIGSAFGSFSAGAAQYQTNRAISMIGAYNDWNPKKTFLTSNIVGGAVSGFLDPSKDMGTGMALGALGGLVNGKIQLAIDGDKIAKNKSPGGVAQGLGSLFGGLVSSGGSNINPAGLIGGAIASAVTANMSPRARSFFSPVISAAISAGAGGNNNGGRSNYGNSNYAGHDYNSGNYATNAAANAPRVNYNQNTNYGASNNYGGH